MHKVSDVKIGQDIMKINKKIAADNNAFFNTNRITVFNVMGAIGSGKTCLIEDAIDRLKDSFSIAVIAGDVVAKFDSDRFAAHGVKVIPVSTGKECHLDAHFIEHAIEGEDMQDIDILFIENVGNLICPSDFDLGEHVKVVVVSVSEGDDIVLKHPVIFKNTDITIVNKIDIAKFVGASAKKMSDDAYTCGCKYVLLTSCKRGDGLNDWNAFIKEQVAGNR